ncbi:MAG: hypothetical protein HDS12_00320 [Bacteroides sp.]|nr:hypothetical protein [Bacteroidales bacterium]MBD5301994.1 hypothetical protein [Bacteroides sp.]MBD5205221.1 hypothetical protein [Bacteroidales bacterium]MBD5224169.1 hypothetical protein [Bacteroidales bacterium]MBD5304726.1 hypothetical protein [Bacteroides sp.]
MKKTCILSFGNSSKYKVPSIECNNTDIKLVEKEVKEYLKVKFPEIEALPFYSSMTVEEVDADEAEGYPEFNAEALKNIEKTLSREVEDARSLDELNNNAPFANI